MSPTDQPQIKILEKQSEYKLIIPAEVQRKIDLLCLKISNIEWSGTLFYDITGNYKENNLVVTVKDIFLQDIGDGASTSFSESPDLVGYIVDHDLLTCFRGLIHSHHNMQAFFSGVDFDTLKKEALDHNHFVSLVVNNKRQYVASITVVYTSEKKAKVIEKKTFHTFNGEEVQIQENTYDTESTEKEVEYSSMSIEIEDYPCSNIELSQRIEELKSKKSSSFNSSTNFVNPSFIPRSTTHQPTLFDDDTPFRSYMQNKDFNHINPDAEKEQIPVIEIDDSIIEHKTKQLITASRIVPKENNININKFLMGMDSLYKNTFKEIEDYRSFLSFYVESVLEDSELFNTPTNKKVDEKYILYYLALGISELLKTSLEGVPESEYIEALLEEVQSYIYY